MAKTAGLELDDWQQFVLTNSLREQGRDQWSAFEVGVIVPRQNGKGAILEARELAGLFEFGEQLILHSAHEFKTAAEAFRRVLNLVDGCDEYRRRVKKVQVGHGDEGIELRNGARLRFVARSTGSGRGFSGDLVILDEAYALTAAHMEALLPTLSARPNPQIWYTSSPPLTPDTGEVLFSVRDRVESADAGRLAWFDYGAEGALNRLDDVDLDDRELWRSTNPAVDIRISEQFIASERRAMTIEGFARERLGIWPPKMSRLRAVIDADMWSSLALSGQITRPESSAFALHVNADRTRAWIAYAGRREDGLLQVGIVDPPKAGTGWVVDRLEELKGRWNPPVMAVDTRSESLLTDLEKRGLTVPEDPEHPRRGDLAVPSAADTAAAFGLLVDAARNGRLRHADDAPVNTALAEAGTRSLAGGLTWDHKHGEIGPLKAVTLAVWAFETRAHLVEQDLDEIGVF